LLEATTKGLEIAGHWSPIPLWRLDGSYTAFRVTPKLSPLSTDPSAAADDASTPESQWQLRSAFKLGTRGTLDVGLFHVGRLRQFDVDAYTRMDVTAEWSLTSSLSAMVIGQNLLEAEHAEFSNKVAPLGYSHVPRSVSLRLRWMVR
jgi:outer membrane receptor protein involved in Fe transport